MEARFCSLELGTSGLKTGGAGDGSKVLVLGTGSFDSFGMPDVLLTVALCVC